LRAAWRISRASRRYSAKSPDAGPVTIRMARSA
jgi:hypothetical protein